MTLHHRFICVGKDSIDRVGFYLRFQACTRGWNVSPEDKEVGAPSTHAS